MEFPFFILIQSRTIIVIKIKYFQPRERHSPVSLLLLGVLPLNWKNPSQNRVEGHLVVEPFEYQEPVHKPTDLLTE